MTILSMLLAPPATLVAAGAVAALYLLFTRQRSLVYASAFPAGSRTTCAAPASHAGRAVRIRVPRRPRLPHKVRVARQDKRSTQRYVAWLPVSVPLSGFAPNTIPQTIFALAQRIEKLVKSLLLSSTSEVTDSGLDDTVDDNIDVDINNDNDTIELHAIELFGRDSAREHGATHATTALPRSRDVIVWLHGNAGNAGHRLFEAQQLLRVLPSNVDILLIDYRGFGTSNGSARERALVVDTVAITEWCRSSHPEWDAPFLYGQSIGGAAALHAAALACAEAAPNGLPPIKGLILENTFTTLAALVDAAMPLVIRKLAFMLVETWDSAAICRFPDLSGVNLINHRKGRKNDVDIVGNDIDKGDVSATIGEVRHRDGHVTDKSNNDKDNDDDDEDSMLRMVAHGHYATGLPVLLVSSGFDEVVPPLQMETLFELLLATKQRLRRLQRGYGVLNTVDDDDENNELRSAQKVLATCRSMADITGVDDIYAGNKVNETKDSDMEVVNEQKDVAIRWGSSSLRLWFVRLPQGRHNDTVLQRGFGDAFARFVTAARSTYVT